MTSDFAIQNNITIGAGLLAWFIAQLIKFITHFKRTQKIDFGVLVSLGGMPSSHSSTVSAIATSIGLQVGFSSPLFALAFTFAFVVMFDAQSVRKAAGMQAKVVNQITEELFKEHHLSQEKLVELLGHTQVQVLFGCLLGIAVALGLHL